MIELQRLLGQRLELLSGADASDDEEAEPSADAARAGGSDEEDEDEDEDGEESPPSKAPLAQAAEWAERAWASADMVRLWRSPRQR